MAKSQSLRALVSVVNEFMRKSSDIATAERSLIQTLTESLLMAKGEYSGFNYSYWMDRGFREWDETGKPDFPEKDKYLYGPSGDRTRIQFYI
jgi:hypothetical protein